MSYDDCEKVATCVMQRVVNVNINCIQPAKETIWLIDRLD